jgi:hypothetical protein
MAESCEMEAWYCRSSSISQVILSHKLFTFIASCCESNAGWNSTNFFHLPRAAFVLNICYCPLSSIFTTLCLCVKYIYYWPFVVHFHHPLPMCQIYILLTFCHPFSPPFAYVSNIYVTALCHPFSPRFAYVSNIYIYITDLLSYTFTTLCLCVKYIYYWLWPTLSPRFAFALNIYYWFLSYTFNTRCLCTGELR